MDNKRDADGKRWQVATGFRSEYRQTGWLTIPICAGTHIAYTLPARLRSIAAPDNACWTAFQYGPVVLAGVLDVTDPLTNYSYAGVMVRMADFDASAHAKSVIKPSRGISASQWLQHLDDNLVRVNGAAPDSSSLHEASSSRPSASPQPSFGPSWSFRFRHVDGAASRIILKPYYSLYRSSYAMYFDIVDQNSPHSIDAIANDRSKPHAASITSLTYDSVTPDQGNNMEVTAHLRHSENSRSASLSGRTYRDAGPGGWFSYDLRIDAESTQSVVAVEYAAADAGKRFELLITGVPADSSPGRDRDSMNGQPHHAEATPFHVVLDRHAALDGNAAAPSKQFHWGYYAVPQNILRQSHGLQHAMIRITFLSSGSDIAAIYGVRTLDGLPDGQ